MVPRSTGFPAHQNVSVVLRINDGSFERGFPVTLQILEDGKIIQEDDSFLTLPAAPEIPALYQAWSQVSLQGSRKLQIVQEQIINVAAEEDWKQITDQLAARCRSWFQDPAFRQLCDRIRANRTVNLDQSLPVIIRCHLPNNDYQNQILRRLPWHFWSLFTYCPHAEFALFTQFHERVLPLQLPIKVLAIFGSSQGGLQLQQDAAALELLKARGAEISHVIEPTEAEISQLLFDQAWDVLFFAGHSSSEGESGRIQLSQSVSMPLQSLRQGLRKAVSRGLKLALFNSCDGLSIADFLKELDVPAMIVMREPVPDQVACQFLLHFLKEFSQGTPLCRSTRSARDRLEAMQSSFPAASWLPVVCLSPNQPDLVWPQTPILKPAQPNPLWKHLQKRWPLGLVGLVPIAAGLMFLNRCQLFESLCPAQAQELLTADAANAAKTKVYSSQQLISIGSQAVANSKVQLSEPYLSLKREGIAAFAEQRYEDAIATFDQVRTRAQTDKKSPGQSQAALAALQDPEILIYRNNAFAKLRHQQNPNSPLYTIASAAPLNVDAGIHMTLGVAQAQDVAIKQGINLQVVIANDSNDPAQAEKVAAALANNPDILAVIGHYTSPNTCAGLKVYSPKNLVVISPTSTVVGLQSDPNCGGDPNKVFFRTVSNSRVEASSSVEYLINDLGKSKPQVVVFYNSNEAFSKNLYNQFRQVVQAYHGTITATVDFSAADFTTQQLPPEAATADALVMLPDGGTGGANTVEQAISLLKLNNGNKPVLAANTLYLQSAINQVGPSLINNLFIAVDWHKQQCGADAFSKQINTYWGGDLNGRTALAYEAVQAVSNIIVLNPNASITRQDIQKQLTETGIRLDEAAQSDVIEGLRISFDERGDRREITTRTVVTVDSNLRFSIVKGTTCPTKP
jgi:branched-chain amino acid transport system substrate-binding protein